MSKSKKHKKPNIPPSVLARPRLDAILDGPNREPDAMASQVEGLMQELGIAPVLDSFVKRVQVASSDEQAELGAVAARLATAENINHLWDVVKRQGGMSEDAKRAALVLLHAMGAEVALDDMARYLPEPRLKSSAEPKRPEWREAPEQAPPEWFEPDEDKRELSEKETESVREIIAELAFGPPVEQFLYLDRPGEFDELDYLQQGITNRDIPELIRMATSRTLNRVPYPSSLVWAPIHAWRALGQLGATEAVQPLLGLLKYIDQDQDDWITEDMPRVFGQIGSAALEPLGQYLDDDANPLWARVASDEGICEIGKNHPDARAQAIALLMRTLERYTENDPILNADIIYAQSRLRAVEALPLIEKAFAADRVDESLNGDWEDLQIQFGLIEKRTKPPRKTWLDMFRLR